MSNCIDVIYELTQKDLAIWQVFTIDKNVHLLNTRINPETGDIVLPDNWNDFWRVHTKAPGADLYNTRFLISDYLLLLDAGIAGFNVLASGYPADDIETMLAERKLQFTRIEIDQEGNSKEVPDMVENDIRIAPTAATCDRYRALYPATFTTLTIDIPPKKITLPRGNFSRHGL